MSDEECEHCEGQGDIYNKDSGKYEGICLECNGIGYISAFGKGVK